MALDYVTAGLDARHRAALDAACERRQASKTAVLRQAIRLLDFCDRKAMQGKSLTWTDDDGAPMRVFDEIQRTEAEFAASLDPRGRKQATEETIDERREQHVPAAVPDADGPREDAGRGGEGEGGGADAGDQGAAPGP